MQDQKLGCGRRKIEIRGSTLKCLKRHDEEFLFLFFFFFLVFAYGESILKPMF